MRYLSRNIEKKIKIWQNNPSRRPLILRGARQVGKSALVHHFGTQNFSTLVTVNFERQPNFCKIFELDFDVKRIIRELEVITGQKIEPGKTLLFFDEIQSCPNALKSLRYFFEEAADLHVIAAGSLLELIQGDVSFPVGRVEYMTVHPMSFSEFLIARGHENSLAYIPKLSSNIDTARVPDAIDTQLTQLLKEYFIVGGMPKVVSTFLKNMSYIDVHNEHAALLQSFRDDIPKYAKGDLQIKNLSFVFERLFSHVGKQINYTKLGDNDLVARTKHSLFLLEKARLLSRIPSTIPNLPPLAVEASTKFFKCLFLDVGLGQFLSGRSPTEILNSDNLLAQYDGRIAEQFVGQQLLSESENACEGGALYCWIRAEKNSTAEVDYVVNRNSQIIPVEVKSGKSGSLKSLHLCLKTYQNKHAICLQTRNSVEHIDNIIFAPIYSLV